jgi:hypothetical protein
MYCVPWCSSFLICAEAMCISWMVLITCVRVASDSELMQKDAAVKYYTNIMPRYFPVSEV